MNIITPALDLENWKVDMRTGCATMLNAMHTCDTSQWVDRSKSVEQLVQWWVNIPPYDPDVEPESLIQRKDLTDFQAEVIGIAAMRRILNPDYFWNFDEKENARIWLSGERPKIAKHILDFDTNNVQWWYQCLFEHRPPEHADITEYLITSAHPNHHFSTLSNTIDMPLHELLRMLLPAAQSSTRHYDPLNLPDMW